MTAVSNNLISMLAQQLAGKPSQGANSNGTGANAFDADGSMQDFFSLMSQGQSANVFTGTNGNVNHPQDAHNLIDSQAAQTRWLIENGQQFMGLNHYSEGAEQQALGIANIESLTGLANELSDLTHLLNSDYAIKESQQFQSMIDAIDLSAIDSASQLSVETVTASVFGNELGETTAVLLVELSSLATGKLSQVAKINQQLLTAIEATAQQQSMTLNNSLSGLTSVTIINTDFSTNVNKPQSPMNQSVMTSGQSVLGKDSVKNVEQSSAKSMIQSLFSKEYQSKNISFIYNDDGVKVWYRDYASDASRVEQELAELKSYLENFIQIKSMGLNGKLLYKNSNNEGGF